MNEYKEIQSVEEITEEDILKGIKYKQYYSSRWFEIQKDSEGYCIYGKICGDMPTFVAIGNYVKFWKTLSGVRRAITKFTINHHWGFHIMLPQIKKD